MPRFVMVEHSDGRQYAVLPADFKATYAEQGFKVAGYEADGGPEMSAEERRDLNAEAKEIKAEAREEAKAEREEAQPAAERGGRR
jgi:hypothetical protein